MTSDHTQPLVTIGITCFNAENTIARAIRSALAQDWKHLEVLVVDDCSTDHSPSVVETAIAGKSSARLITHEINQGPAGARQTIVENARGDLIVFFDDDDEALPERAKTQYERIISYEKETGETLIACYTSGRRQYPNDYEVALHAIGSRQKIPHGAAIADYLLFYAKTPGLFYGAGTPACALMARKSTFEAVGGFDQAFRRVEDVDFAIRLALSEGHFIGCPQPLSIRHATEASDKAPAMNLEAEIQLADKHKHYLQSVGYYDYAKRWPLSRYYHFMGQHWSMLLALLALFVRYPLKVTGHFLQTAPRRFFHERRMKKEQRS